MVNLFRIIGAIGLGMIVLGILLKDRKAQDLLYIGGGIFLLTYSWSIRDPVFIPLQIIFSIAAAYDYFSLEIKKHKKLPPRHHR